MSFPTRSVFVVVVLFAVAFGLRLVGLSAAPFDFHPARQFRDAVYAHVLYARDSANLDDQRRRVVEKTLRDAEVLEPPVNEYLAALAYRAAGGEHLWMPRLFSVIYWMVAGLFLHRLALRVIGAAGALVALAVFLFLPFGFQASRSFQPDPMMLMLLVSALYLVERYARRPSAARLILAAGTAGAAALIKPTSMFFTTAAFLALRLDARPTWRALLDRHTVAFGVASVSPLLAYVTYATLYEGGLFMPRGGRILPQLLLNRHFWDGWAAMIDEVFGVVPFSIAVACTALVGQRRTRMLLASLWLGAFVYGCVFTVHVSTHTYYQLPVIPVFALGLGVLGQVTFRQLAGIELSAATRATVTALLAGASVWPCLTIARLNAYKTVAPRHVLLAREVGEKVAHSTNVLFLAHASGEPLRYYGELAGSSWPASWELEGMSVDLVRLFREMRDVERLDYFVVTRMKDFEKQRELKEFVTSNFPVLARAPDYVIFDLRSPAPR